MMLRLVPESEIALSLNEHSEMNDIWRLPAIQAMEYINRLFAMDLQVGDIARFCHVSESYLHHIFKRAYQCGPYEMILTRRLEKVKHLLATSELPIFAVAQKCGFSDANYLSAVFHKKFRTTCSKYRKRMREQRE